jgi:hypothetical protein
MADRYAVATGNWNSTGTWSATSGGASGASFPTSSDNAIFDAASGAITVTVNVDSACVDLLMNGSGGASPFTGTFAGNGSSILSIYGSVSLSGSMTQSFDGPLVFAATSSGKTITTNGKAITSFPGGAGTHFDGAGGAWTLQDNLTATVLRFTNGTVDTNGKTLAVTGMYRDSAGTATLTLGASVITCTGARNWVFTVTAGFTFNCGTSTINFNGNNGEEDLQLAGLTYYTVVVGDINGTNLRGANTFTNLTFASATAARRYVLYDNQTVTGTFTATGNNAGNQRIQIYPNTLGTARTITAAAVSLTNVDFQDITGAGAATWSGTSVGNGLGNTGITFTTPVTRYYIGNTANWFTTASWSTSSGGSSGASIPLAQDAVVFDANSFSGNGQTCTINWTNSNTEPWICANLDMSGVNRTGITIPNNTSVYLFTSIFGNLTGNAGVAFTSVHFCGRGSHTITSSSMPCGGVRMYGPGGTYTQQDAFLSSQGAAGLGFFSVNYGTWNTNGFSFALSGNPGSFGRTTFWPGGTFGTAALNCGSSTITLPKYMFWEQLGSFTFNAGTSTFVLNEGGGGSIFRFGGLTFYKVRLTGTTGTGSSDEAGTIAHSLLVDGAASWTLGAVGFVIGNLDFTQNGGMSGTFTQANAMTVTGSITLASGMTATISGAISLTGTGTQTITSAGKTFGSNFTQSGVGGTAALADAFVTTGSYTLTHGTLGTGTASASLASLASSNANTRAITGSGNITVTGTGTVWNAATSTNLTASGWTGSILVTNASGSAKTVDLGAAAWGGGLTLSGSGAGAYTVQGANSSMAGAATVSNTGGASLTLYGSAGMSFGALNFTGFTGTWTGSTAGSTGGSVTLAAGMTMSYTGTLTLTGTTTRTITSAGKTFGGSITQNGAAGTYTIQDAIVVTGTLTLTNGTFAANSLAVSLGALALGSGTKTLNVSGITVTLTGAGTVWNVATNATGFTGVFTDSTIILNNASASDKVFYANSLTYNDITVSGAGSGDFEFRNGFTVDLFTILNPPHTVNWQTGSLFYFTQKPAFSGTSGNLNTLVGVA